MFMISPNSAGSEPEILFHEKSIHVRLFSAPIPVQFEIEPVMLLSCSVSAVIRPALQSYPSR